MFKKIILILALICMIVLPVFGQSGNYTLNGYFYLPLYGAYGMDEYNEYNLYMEKADNQIEANKGTFGSYYLKTEIDTLSELEAIYTKDITDSDELASALTLYYLKTAIDTIGEVEAIWVKDITDSEELAVALTDYYLKSAIDTQGEVETIWEVTLATDTELAALKFIDLDDTPAAYDNGKYAKSTADGVVWDTPAGYTNLTSFVDQTAWRIFYSNTDGDVVELALGTDGQCLTSTGATSAPAFETPAGAGDMLKATYDTDEDDEIDVAGGGTEKDSWTQYCIPYLSNTTVFGEIPIGTAEYALTVNSGANGYDWTLLQTYDAGLLSLAGLTYASPSFIKVTAEDTYAIRTLAEVKTDLGIDLSLYYLKTEMNEFSELQAIISDKTLVNTTDKLNVFASITEAELYGVLSDVTLFLEDLVDDTTPELGGEMDAGAHSIGFTQQTITYNVTTTTVDWTSGNKATVTLTGNVGTLAFTNPTNPCNVLLKIIQDATGSRLITAYDADVMWVGGTKPTLTTTANGIDICSFYWDGTNYFGVASLAFATP